MGVIKVTPTTKEAYDLFHQGSIALAEAEYNGIRVDRDYCERMVRNTARQHESLEQRLRETDLGRLWEQRYGGKTNFGSDAQLRKILYQDMGLVAAKSTSGGKDGKNKQESVDADTLEKTGLPDVKFLLQMAHIEKQQDYLKNMLRESEADGFMHPFFNLTRSDFKESGGARSLRSSSDSPNFQNFPKRNGDNARIVRRGVIPRDGHRIVGRDYNQLEVTISCCCHQDKNMIHYIEQGKDMHQDCASMLYLLPPEQCCSEAGPYGKQIRQSGKSDMVFPQFYLQEPANSAKGLWTTLTQMPLRCPYDPAKLLTQHLAEKGIRTYEAFEAHAVKVIEAFWRDMFPGFGKWRDKWIADYEKKGFIEYLSGFRIEGHLTKYQLGNFPIQGPAFHCMLWSLIHVLEWWKTLPGWRSLLLGQIHDELVTDEHDEELRENEVVIPRIMTQDLRKAWPWIIVPLKSETTATGIGGQGGNWFERDKALKL